MTDFETWLHDNSDRIYRYWVYRRMFTPYEQAEKFTDESCFQSTQCCLGIIKEAIELPDGDILIGFEDPEIIGTPVEGYIHYYKLSEINLDFCPLDEEQLDE